MKRYVLTHTVGIFGCGGGLTRIRGTIDEIRAHLLEEWEDIKRSANERGVNIGVYSRRFFSVLPLLDATDPVTAFAERFGWSIEGETFPPLAYLLTEEEQEARHSRYIAEYRRYCDRIGATA